MSLTIASRPALVRLLQSPAHVRAIAVVRNERAHQLDLALDAAHDDAHTDQELAYAALSYLMDYLDPDGKSSDRTWPWPPEASRYRSRPEAFLNLTAAAALLLAEIERLMRLDPGLCVADPAPAATRGYNSECDADGLPRPAAEAPDWLAPTALALPWNSAGADLAPCHRKAA